MKVGSLKLKLQLVCGDAFALGPGKADLLDAIDREGSISAAGRAMNMSYRRAWLLVDEMNRCFKERVVETAIGGGSQRGARLTEAGKAALADYRELERDAEALAERPSLKRLTLAVRGTPIASETS
ncbi:winged helix-turn-helix domain-containing protein [uncultured Sphingomonas sp.]|uniref:winged helix-turn-helix domain-containing protein n=1 Tax=uncultured Sphingomonas sp. TaxID=158754 RepID=UPI0035CB897D